jgi:DNA-binding response OmpR family regulator
MARFLICVRREVDAPTTSPVFPTPQFTHKEFDQMNPNNGRPTSRVLIADDDPVIRHWITSILEADRYKVVSTSDGRDAYRLLQNDADFAGAVFDMSMPFLEGSDLIKFMRTEKRLMRIPVMLITAESDIRLVANGFAAGATVLLPKPFTRKRLQATLRMMLGPAAAFKPTSLPTATQKGFRSIDRFPNVATITETENAESVSVVVGPVDLSILIEDGNSSASVLCRR